MRLLHIAETIRGGPATYLDEMIPLQVDEFGIDSVRVLIPEDHVIDLSRVSANSIATFRRPGRMSGLPFLTFRALSEIRSFRPDIIHVHSTFAGLIVRSLAVVVPRMPPIVYCPHGWSFDMDGGAGVSRVCEWMEWLLAFKTHRIVAISEYEYEQGTRIGISRSKLAIVENGISATPLTTAKAEWSDPRLHVLFVGRLDKQKGVDILLKAASELSDQISVRVIGANVTNARLRLTIPDNVQMLGWMPQNEIAAQLAACDVVAMPSRWEGFGLVAIEAMRSCKPVAASRVGGLSSIVLEGLTGALVPKEDPSALATALISKTAAEWSELGRASRERFLAKYTVEQTHKKLLKIYTQLRPDIQFKA